MSNPAPASLRVDSEGHASIEGGLTFDSVSALLATVSAPDLTAPGIRQVDLAGVSEADSAGLAFLLEWQAIARGKNSGFEIINAPNALMRLARLSEAIDVLNMTERHEA